MAGMLLPYSNAQYVVVTGGVTIPMALAEMHFSLATTTTPSPVYEDVDLAIPHSNPVVADADGIFPAMYFDPDIPLRMRFTESGGDEGSPIFDVDPCSATLVITAGQIEDDAIETKLGYTPVNPDDDVVFSELVRITKTLDEADGTEVGYRGLPISTRNANHTFVLDEIGKCVRKDDTGSYAWTVPLNSAEPFPVGSRIFFHNGNTTNITLDKTATVVLVALGDPSFTDIASTTISPNEWGFLHKVGTNTWMLYKAGLFPTVTLANLPASGTAGQQMYVSDLGGGAGLVTWDAGVSKWVRVRTEGYSVENTNVNFTWTPLSSAPSLEHTGTLTADRTATLSTTNAYPGLRARFTRTGGGAFNLSIGGLKNLATDEWCEVTFDGTSWFLSAFGAL